MTWLPKATGALLLPPVSAWAWQQVFRWLLPRLQWRSRDILIGWGCSASFGIIFGPVSGEWAWAAGSAASLTIAVVIWLYRRRKRKRAPGLLGAKSRALRAALVRAMRRERKPSRVLRPHPVPS